MIPTEGISKFLVFKLEYRDGMDIQKLIYRYIHSCSHLERPYVNGKHEVIVIKYLHTNDDDEAYSWKQAYIMYLNLEASIFRVKLPIINKQTQIGTKFWEAFTEICEEHGIRFTIANSFSSEHEIAGYNIVENEPLKLDKNDFRKTVYKVQVDELIYIGEATIRASSGRDSHFALRSTLGQRKKLQCLIDRHHAKGLAFEDLPVTTIAFATSVNTPALYMESLVMLAFMLENQFLNHINCTLVNKNQSTCFMRWDWLNELQLILWKLFKKTFEMHGKENLLYEHTLLHKAGMKRGDT